MIDNQIISCTEYDNLIVGCTVTLPYKTFNHTADLGVEIYGSDPYQLFVNAGKTLFHLISGSGGIEENAALLVTAEENGYEDLMVSWLRELLYLQQVKGYLLSTFIIHQLDDSILKATVKGELFDGRRHEMLREIKAVTYHQLSVKREQAGWTARIVFDI